MFRKAFLASVMVFALAAVASAAPTIVAGVHEFAQNSGNQSFYITTFGSQGDEFSGTDLQFEIMGANSPMVVAFDLISDPTLLFFGNTTGQFDYGDPGSVPPTRTPGFLTTTLTGSVGPTGNLAKITINTDVPFGEYPIVLEHPLFGVSDLPPFFPGSEVGNTILQNGLIRITPEPSSIVMGLFAAAGLGALVIRRRRVRKAA